MRTSTILIIALALSLWALPAHAQQDAESDVKVRDQVVTLALQSQVVKPTGSLELPSSIMQQMTDQEPLTQLDVETNSGHHTRLRAQFTFRSMEEFSQWHESESVQELIRLLNEGQNSTTLALHIERQRF